MTDLCKIMDLLRNIIIAFCCIALLTLPASAAEMSLKQVIETVLANHPDLNISRIDSDIAATETDRIEGALDPLITASASASTEKTPTVSNFQPSENRIGQLSGTISKPFANGSTLSASMRYTRNSNGYNSPFAANLALFNPSYRNQIDINYRYPLLKGAERPDYNQSLISAKAGVAAANKQRQVIAHNLSLQAMNLYYQLASDDINIDIAKQAVKRARKLLSYQRSREQFGLIEKADRLQAAALLAARKTDLQRAKSVRLRNQNTLNRLMLRPALNDITVRVGTPLATDTASIEAALKQAEQLRPELQVLNAQLQAADAQLAIARDADQPQLDIITTLGTRSLARTPLPAAAQGFSIHDHFASLSFELSDALGRHRANAAIRKAELQRQRIAMQRISAIKQIRDDISSAKTAIIAGKPTLALAKKQVMAEQQQFTAEMQRYRQGRSDTATVVQFESELRSAALNAKLQQLTIELAEHQFQWAQGKLRHELGLLASSAQAVKP